MEKTQSLRELYEKDFYLWVQEKNLWLLKNRELNLVDWENLLEDLDSAVSFMAVILERLYKWENFGDREDVGYSWISSINNVRNELDVIFERHPSVRKKSAEELPTAWRIAVRRLVRWFKEDENNDLAKNTLADFPRKKIYHRNALIPLSR